MYDVTGADLFMLLKIVLGTCCVVVLVSVLWYLPTAFLAGYIPDRDKPNDKIRLENELRTTFIQIIGGLFVAGGLFFAYRNLVTLQNGQVTDRYTKAVEQLGNEKLSVRLGGLYSLEQVARESDRDYPAIIELLCSYARENSKNQKREDVQSALSVIGRLNGNASGEIPRHQSLSLADLDLHEMNLNDGNFSDIFFDKTNFTGANLANSRFSHASLPDCVFDDADLTRVVLNDADLSRAHFRDAKLFEAKLINAKLSGASLKGASLWRADLTRTNFTGAMLTGAFLLGATIKQTEFRGAHLTETLVRPEQLEGLIDNAADRPTPNILRIMSVLHAIGFAPVGPKAPVKNGDFLAIYCEGLGDLKWPDSSDKDRWPHTATTPKVTINGQEVSVTYAGISPRNPATYQINVSVLLNLPTGTYPLQISTNGSDATMDVAWGARISLRITHEDEFR